MPANIKMNTIHWLAGIIEGEGNFQIAGSPRIRIAMTDLDVIQKVATLFNSDIHVQAGRKEGYKTQYLTAINGNDAIAWMFTLYSILSKRRKTQIEKCVIFWKQMIGQGKGVRGPKVLPEILAILNGAV